MRSLRDYRFNIAHFGVMALVLAVLSVCGLCAAVRQSPGELFQRLGAALTATPAPEPPSVSTKLVVRERGP